MDNMKNWISKKSEVEFPDCYFGVKNYNHVHEKIFVVSILGDFVFLGAAIFCFFNFDAHIWHYFLAIFGLFMMTTVGNTARIKFLYFPLWIILFATILFIGAALVAKIVGDFATLNQHQLHRFLPDMDRGYPKLGDNERIDLIVVIMMEFLIFFPLYVMSSFLETLTKAILYIDQEKKNTMKRLLLPVCVDPFVVPPPSERSTVVFDYDK